MKYVNENLQNEIRLIFEPRYNRELTPEEVFLIAANLVSSLEVLLKHKWKYKYGKPKYV